MAHKSWIPWHSVFPSPGRLRASTSQASYTRHSIGSTAPPEVGECLHCDRDSKIFEIVENKVKCHDMLFMACIPSFYAGKEERGHRSCAGNVAEAMNQAGFYEKAEDGEGTKFEW